MGCSKRSRGSMSETRKYRKFTAQQKTEIVLAQRVGERPGALQRLGLETPLTEKTGGEHRHADEVNTSVTTHMRMSGPTDTRPENAAPTGMRKFSVNSSARPSVMKTNPTPKANEPTRAPSARASPRAGRRPARPGRGSRRTRRPHRRTPPRGAPCSRLAPSRGSPPRSDRACGRSRPPAARDQRALLDSHVEVLPDRGRRRHAGRRPDCGETAAEGTARAVPCPTLVRARRWVAVENGGPLARHLYERPTGGRRAV